VTEVSNRGEEGVSDVLQAGVKAGCVHLCRLACNTV